MDLACLAKAWRQTLRTCPFFEQGIEIENDRLVYVPRRSKCQVTDFSEKKPFADGDLAWVQAEDNKIRVGVSHALTDEFGSFPVNLRAFCRKDHALRNFSLHQAAICDPKSFYREALAEGSSGLIALLKEELRPESLVYAINWIKRRAEGQPFPNDMAIRRHQTIAAGGGDVEVRAVMW